MIVSFGTCDLKLYTVKFLFFLFAHFSRTFSRFSFFFSSFCSVSLVRHVLTVFIKEKKDIVNVPVESYVRQGRQKRRLG